MPWHRPFPKLANDNFFDFNPFRWPFYKFEGLKPEDIWGHLHDRFNTAPIAILDKEAWHADLVDLVSASKSLEELYAQLEERKKMRLEELKSAIAFANGQECSFEKWGTPLHDLGKAMRNLRSGASVFEAASAFIAMRNFVKEKEDEFDRAIQNEIKAEREEILRSLGVMRPIGDDRDTISTNSTTVKRANLQTPSDTTGSPEQPHSPIEKPHLDTNETPKNNKRKFDEAESVTGPSKKRHVTPPASLRSPCTGKRNPIGNSNDKPQGAEEEVASSLHPKISGLSTSLDHQEHSTLNTEQQKSLSDSRRDTDEDAAAVVKTTELETTGSPGTAQSPRRRHDDISGFTQDAPRRIHYECLGWQTDYGPSDKALPRGEQQDDADTLGLKNGPCRPYLESGAKRLGKSRPAAGS